LPIKVPTSNTGIKHNRHLLNVWSGQHFGEILFATVANFKAWPSEDASIVWSNINLVKFGLFNMADTIHSEPLDALHIGTAIRPAD